MCCSKCGYNLSDKDFSCPICGKDTNRKVNIKNNHVTIKECFVNFFVKGFDGDGVSTCKEYLIILFFQFFYIGLLTFFKLQGLLSLINIVLFFPFLSLSVRRFHDIDMSGGYVVIYGYALIAYMFYHFVSDPFIQNFLLYSSLFSFLINLFFMTKETKENSRYNPYNGYM